MLYKMKTEVLKGKQIKAEMLRLQLWNVSALRSGTLLNTQHAEKLLMNATEASSLSRLEAISSKEVKAIRVIVS